MAAHAVGADQHDHAQMLADQPLGAVLVEAPPAAGETGRTPPAADRPARGSSACTGALEQGPVLGLKLVEIGAPAGVDTGRVGKVGGVEPLDERAIAAVEEGCLLEARRRPGHRSRHLQPAPRPAQSWAAPAIASTASRYRRVVRAGSGRAGRVFSAGHRLHHGLADIGGAFGDPDPGVAHGLDLLLAPPLPPAMIAPA